MFGEIQSYRKSNGAYGINAEPWIKLLSEFGLSEKEAQLYVHLLKDGPKRAGDLADPSERIACRFIENLQASSTRR